MSDYFGDWAEINCIDEKSGQIDAFLRHVPTLEELLASVPENYVAEQEGGTKYDSGKPDLSLVPRVALEEIAKALMHGEKKYGRYNYLKGFDSNRLIAATLRHVHAWNSGEDNDPESGLSHVAHALAGLSMLLDCQRVGTLTDGRFKGGK